MRAERIYLDITKDRIMDAFAKISTTDENMKVLDLYSGMGGLSLGFTLALKNVEIFGMV